MMICRDVNMSDDNGNHNLSCPTFPFGQKRKGRYIVTYFRRNMDTIQGTKRVGALRARPKLPKNQPPHERKALRAHAEHEHQISRKKEGDITAQLRRGKQGPRRLSYSVLADYPILSANGVGVPGENYEVHLIPHLV